MKKLLCGLVGVAGLATSVNAQVNWTTNLGFVRGTSGTPLAGNTLDLTATGVYTFTVQVGIFNVTGLGTGQSNQGVNNWTANAAATGLGAGETLGVTTSNSRVAPFNFGPATSFGGTLVGTNAINNINAARDVSGGATAPWLWDADNNMPFAQPTAPQDWAAGNFAPRGINSLASIFRFTVNVTSLSGPNIVINFTGQAGPVIQWAVFGANTPDPDNSGNVSFLGLTPTPVLRDYTPTSLTLTRIVPAPGAAALLGLGGLVAVRRRR